MNDEPIDYVTLPNQFLILLAEAENAYSAASNETLMPPLGRAVAQLVYCWPNWSAWA